ncbi:hypothetical protein GJW-30_1_01795 [Variibacter gotjawalensis]|uniref:PASTA domain-containing protein n=1 Tax=Variibacter gotjawalensis TaxID=1333996 RepID=A0A0S3PTV8_9BRAD|nr:hypothetical protein [Variibacter gotjawalensis]NIK49580.1 hypothetical protein [Variibacter gotjawalensis]RZS45591.1 hypothetical protein EV661_3910 [Variibacter gotjawalensis]BAT59264.1 hypothetical protein GJW-30_1_01795 [Variibacter gotjawalensis]
MVPFRTTALIAIATAIAIGTALAEAPKTRLAQYDGGAKPEPPKVAPQPAPAPPPAAAAPAIPDPETISIVQAELARVGCSVSAPTGQWTPADSQAVELFNQYGSWRFDPSQPSPGLLAALRRHEYRVCPLSCQPGFEAQGNTCVAIEQPPAAQPRGRANRREPVRHAAPTRQERRAMERERRRAEQRSENRRAARAERPSRAERPARGAGRPAGTDARGCRFVPRATAGGFTGDTIEVCN